MSVNYIAYVLQPTSHDRVVEQFAPLFPHLLAHHVTYKFPAERAELPAAPKSVKIMGYHKSDDLEVVVMEIDGNRHQWSADGQQKRYLHMLLSCKDTVRDSRAHDLLNRIAWEEGEAALYNLPPERQLTLDVVPRFVHRVIMPSAARTA